MPTRVRDLLPPGLLPPGLYGSAFIAGGYAACPERATDIDVWVRVSETLEAARANLLYYWGLLGHPFSRYVTPSSSTNNVELPGREDNDGGYALPSIPILQVATIAMRPKPIHVMVTQARLDQVLSAFDISTHQVAINPLGLRILGPQWTPLDVTPQLIRVGGASTWTRLDKIMNRYADLRSSAYYGKVRQQSLFPVSESGGASEAPDHRRELRGAGVR